MSELVPMCFETEFKASIPDSKQTKQTWEISAQSWPKDLARVWLLIKVVFWGQ